MDKSSNSPGSPRQESTEAVPTGVELDPAQLSPGALRGLVEEYVTREGTDYGQGSWSLEDKVAQVLRQIDCGDAKIVFDLESESASVVTTPELALHVIEARSPAPRESETEESNGGADLG
jgi:uncharacterized protein YheU (UPF0270 family)